MNKKSHQFSINKDGFGVMGYDNLFHGYFGR